MDRKDLTPPELRELIRGGEWTTHTSGCCAGYVQTNLVALPHQYAESFRAFCEANPQALPLLEVNPANQLDCAPNADLRTDLPRYRLWRSGEVVGEMADATDDWEAAMEGVLLGCSFTAEDALRRAGVRLRHVELGQGVAMFKTSIACHPVDGWHGPAVVSMRPIQRDQLDLAVSITSEHPLAHGGPIHVGEPSQIGISDLSRPDWGDPIEPQRDEIPVFWLCGVTPQAAIEATRPPIAITHAPGHMFVTDLQA